MPQSHEEDGAQGAGLGTPRGKEREYIPVFVARTGPPQGDTGPLYILIRDPRRYVGSPGRPQDWQGLEMGRIPAKVGVRCWHVSRPCPALPTAVAWLVAQRINQRAKPSIKPT
jgi:hypothetical protein